VTHAPNSNVSKSRQVVDKPNSLQKIEIGIDFDRFGSVGRNIRRDAATASAVWMAARRRRRICIDFSTVDNRLFV